MYQIGKLEYPDRQDPETEDYNTAINLAVERSIDDSVYAVWTSQNEGSELMAIIFQGEVFQK